MGNSGTFKKGYIPWNKGLTKETNIIVNKLSLLKIGNKRNSKTIEKIRKSCTGKVHSLATRKKMSLSHKGSKSHLWKGGISTANRLVRRGLKFRIWREKIFNRDDYTCQKCKNRGIYLHPHHIKSFAKNIKTRFQIVNGITLCKNCHNEYHSIYGYYGSRRTINKFLKEK